jgi:mRNA interferase RelE/StbE
LRKPIIAVGSSRAADGGYRPRRSEAHAYRVKFRDYRIGYEVLDGRLVVQVVLLGHRRDIYRR